MSIIIGLLTKNYIAFIIAVIFISAPFVLYLVSKDIEHHEIALKEDKVDEIKELAERTWKYFEDNLTSENNYLIPDNYQENREKKLDSRTSPTGIGFSLTSVISAYESGKTAVPTLFMIEIAKITKKSLNWFLNKI